MPFIARNLKFLAAPVIIAAIAFAGPALARTVSGAHAASSKTKCFTVTINRKHVRECLVPGPQGPRGRTGQQGPRGFLGPRGSTGKTGSTGKAGPTGKTGSLGPTGPLGPAGSPGPTGPTGAAGAPGLAAVGVVNPHLNGPTSPGFVPAQTLGFSALGNPSTGVYCLTPSASSISGVPITVSGESSYSGNGVIPLAVYDAQPSDCGGGQFEVKTYDLAGASPALSAAAAFSIVVP
jgi:hypothetical protein